MNKLSLFIGLTTLFSTGGFAATVTYSTSGSQLCLGAVGCGVLNQTIGGTVNVSFNPIASSSVDAAPTTFGSFGEIVVSCVGGGTLCDSRSLDGLYLYINIAQTGPSVGNASLARGTIAGTIAGTSSGASINWAVPNGVDIGAISYSVLNNPLGLVPPSVNEGVTSIQANITDNSSVVPEPASYLMLACSLTAIAARRRRSS